MLRAIMVIGCRGKPAANKHRMNQELSSFAARLRDSIVSGFQGEGFDELAMGLFALQFEHNAAYQKLCNSQKMTPSTVCDTLRWESAMLNWLVSLWHKIDRWIHGEKLPQPYRRSNLHGRR